MSGVQTLLCKPQLLVSSRKAMLSLLPILTYKRLGLISKTLVKASISSYSRIQQDYLSLQLLPTQDYLEESEQSIQLTLSMPIFSEPMVQASTSVSSPHSLIQECSITSEATASDQTALTQSFHLLPQLVHHLSHLHLLQARPFQVWER